MKNIKQFRVVSSRRIFEFDNEREVVEFLFRASRRHGSISIGPYWRDDYSVVRFVGHSVHTLRPVDVSRSFRDKLIDLLAG